MADPKSRVVSVSSTKEIGLCEGRRLVRGQVSWKAQVVFCRMSSAGGKGGPFDTMLRRCARKRQQRQRVMG